MIIHKVRPTAIIDLILFGARHLGPKNLLRHTSTILQRYFEPWVKYFKSGGVWFLFAGINKPSARRK